MLPAPHIVDTPLGRFMVWEHEAIGRQLLRQGQWEPANLELAMRLLANSENKNVLDIGAHLGAFAVPVARLGLGTVFAFEPQRIIFQQLCGNAFLNGLDNLVAYEVAVGNPQSSQELIEFPDPDYSREINPGALSILSFGEHDLPRATYFGKGPRNTRRVRYVSIDSLNLEKIGLIKVDVEGAEEIVIRGAINTLVKNRFPPILFEAWSAEWYRDRRNALVQCLNDFGYDVTIVIEYGLAQHETQPKRCNFGYDEAKGVIYFS